MKTLKSLKIILFSALILAMLGFSGCEKPEVNTVVPTTPFILEGCSWTNVIPDTVYIINSSEELANYIDCENDLPQIDFSKQVVLIACGVVPGGVSNVNTELTKTDTKYSLNVDVLLDFTAINGDVWRIFLITSKLNTQNVELIVSSHH